LLLLPGRRVMNPSWLRPILPIRMMSLALTQRTASQGRMRDVFTDAGRNGLRWILLSIGIVLVVFGILISPLPGPGGLPVTVLGLMLVLRNSFAARRVFIRVQRKHTRIVFPL